MGWSLPIHPSPDGAVIVDPYGGWLGVVGGDPDGLGLCETPIVKWMRLYDDCAACLVNEHIGHPDVVGLPRVEADVPPEGVLPLQARLLRPHPGVLGAIN